MVPTVMQYIDTHCHINMMVKEAFDVPLTPNDIVASTAIVKQAQESGVTKIINVGTSYTESLNCIELAYAHDSVYATVGIHPNDCTADYKKELAELARLLKRKHELKIVGIGECGIDYYRPGFNAQRQADAFRAQIELSLEHDIALVVHSRSAYDETLQILQEYAGSITRGIIHCFSYDLIFAQTTINWGFAIGLGGAVTYPKNSILRTVAESIPLSNIVLETDAPFLPPQAIRGKQNHPQQIVTIAQFIADLRNESVELLAHSTTQTAERIFSLSDR